jgi:2-furoyl-CoA dehydrogenase large subunit
VGVATETEAWVGRALPRFEDEALLRGRGRFIDDLQPAPNAGHAAILRSLLAHARITRLDASAALELPGVIGVLTGADVAALSRPFPVGVAGTRAYYAAAHEVARYAGEPLAVVVARDRYSPDEGSQARPGAGGKQSFTITGIRPGDAEVRLDYVGPSRQVGESRKYRFVVR